MAATVALRPTPVTGAYRYAAVAAMGSSYMGALPVRGHAPWARGCLRTGGAQAILALMSRLFRDLGGQRLSSRGSVACIGAFDGLHLGHRALLQRVRERAGAL